MFSKSVPCHPDGAKLTRNRRRAKTELVRFLRLLRLEPGRSPVLLRRGNIGARAVAVTPRRVRGAAAGGRPSETREDNALPLLRGDRRCITIPPAAGSPPEGGCRRLPFQPQSGTSYNRILRCREATANSNGVPLRPSTIASTGSSGNNNNMSVVRKTFDVVRCLPPSNCAGISL